MKSVLILGSQGVFIGNKKKKNEFKKKYFKEINNIDDFYNIEDWLTEVNDWRKNNFFSKWGTVVMVDNKDLFINTMYIPKGIGKNERKSLIIENDYIVEDKTNSELYEIKVGDYVNSSGTILEVYIYSFIPKYFIDNLNKNLYEKKIYVKDIVLYEYVKILNILKKYKDEFKNKILIDIRNDNIYLYSLNGNNLVYISTTLLNDKTNKLNIVTQLIRKTIRDINETMDYMLEELIIRDSSIDCEYLSDTLNIEVIVDNTNLEEQYESESVLYKT